MKRILALFLVALATFAGATETPRPLPAAPNAAWVKRLFDGWRAPVPPRHLFGNLYYVGSIGVSSFLITTPEGHILIDSTFEDSVPQVHRNIEQLGIRVGDIRWLMSSHAHADHTGGHALMKRLAGARIVASAASSNWASAWSTSSSSSAAMRTSIMSADTRS